MVDFILATFLLKNCSILNDEKMDCLIDLQNSTQADYGPPPSLITAFHNSQ